MGGRWRKILVTGSAGHLGEALMRTFRAEGQAAFGVDVQRSPFTDASGTIADRAFVRSLFARAGSGIGAGSTDGGFDAVLHTATLHKPHVATHTRQDFVDTNVTGTLNLLEEAAAAGVKAFVFTSTTSTFGHALVPPPGAPAAWITEDVRPVPKNIYGVTKTAAEDLCALMHRLTTMPTVVLRTSRFFPEDDDDPSARAVRSAENLQANEFLHRRVDIEDVVTAHTAALDAAARIGFGRFIVTATTPFLPEDCAELRRDAAAVLRRRVPGWEEAFAARGWTMAESLDRVYVNAAARTALGWTPKTDFAAILERLKATGDLRSPLARAVGIKGYHPDRRAIYPFA